MAKAMTFRMPDELPDRIKEVTGPRGATQFVVEAIEEKLARAAGGPELENPASLGNTSGGDHERCENCSCHKPLVTELSQPAKPGPADGLRYDEDGHVIRESFGPGDVRPDPNGGRGSRADLSLNGRVENFVQEENPWHDNAFEDFLPASTGAIVSRETPKVRQHFVTGVPSDEPPVLTKAEEARLEKLQVGGGKISGPEMRERRMLSQKKLLHDLWMQVHAS